MKRNEFFRHISSDKMPDIEQVRAKCVNQILPQNATDIKTKNQQPRKKAVIVIALTAFIILSFSVMAIEGVIDRLIFKGVEANQVYTLGPPHLPDRDWITTASYEVRDRQVLKYRQEVGAYYMSGKMEWVYFNTLREAVQHLGFTPLELGYIPEGGVFDNVVLHGAAQDYYDKYTCHINYKTYQDNGDLHRTFGLTAQYVGKNATIKVDTISDIERITLNNGIEALLLTRNYMPYDVPMVHYEIMWIQNNIAYRIGGDFDRDDMIKMAESVE